jgi:hypothetical protein
VNFENGDEVARNEADIVTLFLALEAATGGRTSVCPGGPFEISFGFWRWGSMEFKYKCGNSVDEGHRYDELWI